MRFDVFVMGMGKTPMSVTDFDAARKAMIDSQIRPNEVIDEAVIAAFAAVPREEFVPKSMQDVAYVDEDITLPGGRYMVEAMIMGRMIQSLELQAFDNVLLIGAATGYSAAILSHLCSSVIAIDNRSAAVEKAQDNLNKLEIGNVAVLKSKLTEGYPAEGPYDAIIIEGGVETMPEALLAQLADDGRAVAVWRTSPRAQGEASIWTKTAGAATRRALFNAHVPTLAEFQAKSEFAF